MEEVLSVPGGNRRKGERGHPGRAGTGLGSKQLDLAGTSQIRGWWGRRERWRPCPSRAERGRLNTYCVCVYRCVRVEVWAGWINPRVQQLVQAVRHSQNMMIQINEFLINHVFPLLFHGLTGVSEAFENKLYYF